MTEFTDFIEDSVSQSSVSLPTEPHISECSILVKCSSSQILRKPTSSPCGPSLSASLSPLVLPLIPSIPSEEDSWCSLEELTSSTRTPSTASRKSSRTKDPRPSSRDLSPTSSEVLVVPSCSSSTIRSSLIWESESHRCDEYTTYGLGCLIYPVFLNHSNIYLFHISHILLHILAYKPNHLFTRVSKSISV